MCYRHADWATPVAGLNVRPTHISAKEYYSLSVDNLRTYPVYFPGREPEGYWKMLQRVGPQPLIEPEKLKTETEWIEAGQRVFDEADDLHLRTLDPRFIADARSRELLEQARTRSHADNHLPAASGSTSGLPGRTTWIVPLRSWYERRTPLAVGSISTTTFAVARSLAGAIATSTKFAIVLATGGKNGS